MSLNHQQVDLGSKLPNVTEIDDLRTLMSDKRCSKFAEELSNYKDMISLFFCFDHLILKIT